VTHDPVLATYANRRIVLRDGLIISDEINAEPAAAPAQIVLTESQHG
jgi:putative ABC transport system ATP-binding protein